MNQTTYDKILQLVQARISNIPETAKAYLVRDIEAIIDEEENHAQEKTQTPEQKLKERIFRLQCLAIEKLIADELTKHKYNIESAISPIMNHIKSIFNED